MRSKLPAMLVIVMIFAAGGCSPRGDASCLVFQAPNYEIAGANDYSQRWIDTTIERGVAGCNWPRPKPIGSTNVQG